MANVRTALCLGGAHSLDEDIAAVRVPFHGVVACNDAGVVWPGKLDAWVSLHPEKFPEWIKARAAAGYQSGYMVVAQKEHRRVKIDLVTRDRFPGVTACMSSGIFAAKVALIDLGFDRAILCGIPLNPTRHFFDARPWASASGFARALLQTPDEYLLRLRSMSGRTRVLLGSPLDWVDDHR